MAPAKKSSSKKKNTNKGLEEARRGGEGTRVSLLSSEKEKEKEKLLYVFVSHNQCKPYDYSLFALRIPSPGTIVKTNTSTVTRITENAVNGEVLWTQREEISSVTQPEASLVVPILRFPPEDDWPQVMRCIRLDSKLYFLGGKVLHDGGKRQVFPSEVFVLDLMSSSQEEEIVPSSMRDEPRKVLKRVASMHTGKINPFVSFVADGKIFVVSGIKKCPQTGVEFAQFEIFNPAAGGEGVGEWKVAQYPPPFQNACALFPPLVFGRTVFFVGLSSEEKMFTFSYDIDLGTWSPFCPRARFGCSPPDLVSMLACEGGEVVGETLWNVFPLPKTPKVPLAVRLDISEREKKRMDKKFFNNVFKYYIEHPAGSVLTRLGAAKEEDSPLSTRLCFLQVEEFDGSDPGQYRMSVILFDVHGGDSPKFLTCAHYFAEEDSFSPSYKLKDAHIV